MTRWLALIACVAACRTHVGPLRHDAPRTDDITLYRDVALIRQRVQLDLPATPTTVDVKVAAGVTIDQVVVLDRGGVQIVAVHGPGAADRAPEPESAKPTDDEPKQPAALDSVQPVTLHLDIVAPRAGRYTIALGYATDRLTWNVAYTLTANAARDHAVLRGALAMHNETRIEMRGATARIVDAELGTWRTKSAERLAATLVGVEPPSTPNAEPRELGRLDLGSGETRVELVRAEPRTMSSVLVYDPIGTTLDHQAAVPITEGALGVAEPAATRVTESFEIARNASHTSGLPAGPVRLLEAKPDGTLAMLGKSTLFEAAARVANVDTIAVGTAENVTGHRERRELTVDMEGKRIVEEFVVSLENNRAQPIGVLVREHLYRGQNWTLAYHSAASASKEGAQQISLRTTVPAKSKTDILYVVVYTWGSVIARISELTIQYGKRVAVDDLNLELHAGEIALLLGPNGAGKSTTLSAIAGAVLPSRGAIEVDGENLATAPRSARAKVGFADQPPALYEFFTVEEHVGFVAEARGASPDATQAVLADLSLSKIAKRPCRELSFGMRQRVGLAAALVGPVKLVLLDETLNGLDPHASRAARATLRTAADRGAAILMSTHLLGVAERLCDRIVVMNKGKLVDDRRGDAVTSLLAQGPTAVEDLYVSLIADEGPA